MPLIMHTPSAPSGSPTQKVIPPQSSTITPGASIAPLLIIRLLIGSALDIIKNRFERIDKIKQEKQEIIEVFVVLTDKLV